MLIRMRQGVLLNPTVRERIPEWNSCLLVLLACVLLFSVLGGTLVTVAIAALWCIEGSFQAKIREIRDNKVVLAVMAYFLFNILGLLWSTDINWGFHVVGKQWKFLMLPVFMTCARIDHIKYYIEAFIYGVVVAHIISYLHICNLAWFIPLPMRVTYSPFLAFAIYLTLNRLLFIKLARWKQALFIAIFISTSINMFITNGRMGWLAYLAMLFLISCQYFRKHLVKSVLIYMILLPFFLVAVYNYSDPFRDRIDKTWDGLVHFQVTDPSDQVGRLTVFLYSLEIIRNHPLLGVGTGDFPAEYKKKNDMTSTKQAAMSQPHNQYLLVLTQFGLLGFIVFMSIFYFQIKCAYYELPSQTWAPSEDLKHSRLALPVFFLVIIFSDSYLLAFHTTLLFAFFSAILYKTEGA